MKNLIIILVGIFLIGCEGVEEELQKQISESSNIELHMMFGYDTNTGETFECFTSIDSNECDSRVFSMVFVYLKFSEGGYDMVITPRSQSIEPQPSSIYSYSSDVNPSLFTVTGSESDTVGSIDGSFGDSSQVRISALTINNVQMDLDQSILNLVPSL